MAGRLFRISFSGERGYELAVPARYGAALFALLVERARGARRRALRAGGAERAPDREGAADPRRAARAHDRWTISGSGGCWRPARTASARPGAARPALAAPGREQLVGLRPLEPGGRLLAGAHVLAPGAAFAAENDLGYLTSAASRRRSGTTSRSASCGTGGRGSASGCGRSAGCAASTSPARSCRRSSSIRTEGGCVAELAGAGPRDHGAAARRGAGAARGNWMR